MGLFDPPTLQRKTIQRPIFKYPNNIKRKYFFLLYIVTLVLWMLVIGILGAVIAFIVAPYFIVAIQFWHSWLVWLAFVVLGGFFGTMMGSLIVSTIIEEGIKAGDITKV